MVTDYFKNLNYSESVTPGFYILEGPTWPYFFCAYKDRDLGKTEIVDKMNLLPGEFEFHHIVERQHLADISFSGQLTLDYEELPTAMIHKSEHKQYNTILHVKESRLLYLRDAINPVIKKNSWAVREQAAVKLFGNGVNSRGNEELRSRINILRDIYSSVYEGNEVFKVIADNILREYSRNLNLI